MIDINKQYRTRDGRAVRVLCVDAKSSYPVIGLVTYTDDLTAEYVETWRLDGVCTDNPESPRNLVEVSP
jgi:hypothetical protein